MALRPLSMVGDDGRMVITMVIIPYNLMDIDEVWIYILMKLIFCGGDIIMSMYGY